MPRSEAVQTVICQVAKITENVAIRQAPHFYRDEVIVALMRDRYIKALLQNANPVLRDLAVEWLEAEVSRALQLRDRYGVRLYENYPTRGAADDGFGGQRRWMRLGPQTAAMFRTLERQPEREATHLLAKVDVYEYIANELDERSRAAGRTLCWEDIKDDIGATVKTYRSERVAVGIG